MQLSTNPIAGCDLVSPGPPNLKHICGPKSLPVSYFFYVRKICNFYEIYDTFNKPYSRMRFGFPRASPFGAYWGSQIAPCLLLLSRLHNLQLFMRFMQLSTNPIAGCSLASPGPPHLKQIWVQKSLPVYGFFNFTKNMLIV